LIQVSYHIHERAACYDSIARTLKHVTSHVE